jgi:hypothetical protein
MPRLSDPALLAAWEAGAQRNPAERALALAAAGVPAPERQQVGRWSPGQRDALLLELRAATFGDRLDGLVACPACDEQLEVTVHADDLRAEAGDPGAERDLLVDETGHRITFRLPASQDLAAAAHRPADQALAALVEGCVVDAERGGEPVPARSLPEAAVTALGAAMAGHDPQADIRLACTCPGCGHRWSALFDIGDFLWREVDERARTLLGEVAALAAAFGWNEAEVLELSEHRRRHYLELVGR